MQKYICTITIYLYKILIMSSKPSVTLQGNFRKLEDCHLRAIGQMSGCITTDLAALYSEVVGGADQK